MSQPPQQQRKLVVPRIAVSFHAACPSLFFVLVVRVFESSNQLIHYADSLFFSLRQRILPKPPVTPPVGAPSSGTPPQLVPDHRIDNQFCFVLNSVLDGMFVSLYPNRRAVRAAGADDAGIVGGGNGACAFVDARKGADGATASAVAETEQWLVICLGLFFLSYPHETNMHALTHLPIYPRTHSKPQSMPAFFVFTRTYIMPVHSRFFLWVSILLS
jgi:hypothetical protein